MNEIRLSDIDPQKQKDYADALEYIYKFYCDKTRFLDRDILQKSHYDSYLGIPYKIYEKDPIFLDTHNYKYKFSIKKVHALITILNVGYLSYDRQANGINNAKITPVQNIYTFVDLRKVKNLNDDSGEKDISYVLTATGPEKTLADFSKYLQEIYTFCKNNTKGETIIY